MVYERCFRRRGGGVNICPLGGTLLHSPKYGGLEEAEMRAMGVGLRAAGLLDPTPQARKQDRVRQSTKTERIPFEMLRPLDALALSFHATSSETPDRGGAQQFVRSVSCHHRGDILRVH